MLAQYLVSLGATNLQKSKINNATAVNSSQVNKERTFHVHLLMESFCIVFQKYILRLGFRLGLVLTVFLISHQYSGSRSYKTILIKNEFLLSISITPMGSLRPSRIRCKMNSDDTLVNIRGSVIELTAFLLVKAKPQQQ